MTAPDVRTQEGRKYWREWLERELQTAQKRAQQLKWERDDAYSELDG